MTSLIKPVREGGLLRCVLALVLAMSAGGAAAAGLERLALPGSAGHPVMEAMVWTPCARAAGVVEAGPYLLQGVRGCPVSGASLPLVVITHGQGGTRFGHHDTAAALADAGFVVVAFNHPGDSFGDEAQAQSLAVFESRPDDVSRVIGYMLQRWHGHARLDRNAIGVFGFSRGGYTALALAGAVPSLAASGERLCGAWWSWVKPLCRQIRADHARLRPRADPRIGAVVVLDPLNLFDAAGLRPVRIPVQLWASERGGDGVDIKHVEAVRSALPRTTEYHLAQGAGHFAYLAPCPAALMQSVPRICHDPDGFDRLEWHQRMNKAVVRFFREHLPTQTHPISGTIGQRP